LNIQKAANKNKPSAERFRHDGYISVMWSKSFSCTLFVEIKIGDFRRFSLKSCLTKLKIKIKKILNFTTLATAPSVPEKSQSSPT
jgi:hypothetical protein